MFRWLPDEFYNDHLIEKWGDTFDTPQHKEKMRKAELANQEKKDGELLTLTLLVKTMTKLYIIKAWTGGDITGVMEVTGIGDGDNNMVKTHNMHNIMVGLI